MPPRSDDNVLELDSVSAGYGRLEVLREVSLHVGQGEVVSLLGHNGAGKTTVFRVVSGQIPARSGTLTLLARDRKGAAIWDIARAGVGFVPEGRMLFGSLTVAENLELAAHAKRLTAAETREQMDEVSELFPILAERRRQPASALSGGQQQMLAIARALMGRPRLLVLDEPSLGLAPMVVEQVLGAIAGICASGPSALLIEQNMAALEISARAYLLERGRVTLSDDARNLARSDQVRRIYLGDQETRPPHS